MLALSVRPMWAHAIFDLNKNIENRDWQTDYRGIILIHSARKNSLSDIEKFNQHLRSLGIDSTNISDMVSGAIIGTVEIVDCVLRSDSPWFVGRYGFVLKNPRRFSEPIFVAGSSGLWECNLLGSRQAAKAPDSDSGIS